MSSAVGASAGAVRSDSAALAAILAAVQVVVQAASLFLLYRISVQHIGLAMLGLWSVTSAASTAGRIGDFGFAGAVPRLLPSRLADSGEASVSRLIQTATISSSIGTVLLSLIFYYPLLIFSRSLATSAQIDVVTANGLVNGSMLVLWLTAISLTFQACMDGLGRFRKRVLVSISSSFLNLLVVWVLISRLGAMALVVGALIQAVWAMLGSWIILRTQVSDLPVIPWQWAKDDFRALLRVGAYTQANSLFLMLFEPMSRILAGRLGTLEFAALFDLAAKVAGYIRLVFSSGSQTLVPFFSSVRNDSARCGRLFTSATSITVILSVVLMSVSIAACPMVSLIALRHYDPRFIEVFLILIMGNLLNVISGPAFFCLLGAGNVGHTTKSLMLQAVVFLTVTAAMFALSIPLAVPVGYACAVASSGLYLLKKCYRMAGVSPLQLRRMMLPAMTPLIGGIFICLVAMRAFAEKSFEENGLFLILPFLALGGFTLVRYAGQVKRSVAEVMSYRVGHNPAHP